MSEYTGRYEDKQNFRKFSTITNQSVGEEFVLLCEALDVSIYKRLKTLIERDIIANRGIIGTLPEKGEQSFQNRKTCT